MSRKGRHGRSRSGSSAPPARRAKGNRPSQPTPSPVDTAGGATAIPGAAAAASPAVAPSAQVPAPIPVPPPESRAAETAPEPARASEAPLREPTGDTTSQTPLAFDSPVSASAANEDSSYPPVDLDADFFASAPRSLSDPSIDLDDRDPRMVLKLTPGVARRRQQLTKYVKAAVGLASAVCLAALVKVAVAGHGESDAPRRHVSAAQSGPPAPAASAEAPAQAAAYVASAAGPSASAVASASAEPVAASAEPPPAAPDPQPSGLPSGLAASAASASSAPVASAESPATTPEQVQAPDADEAKKEKTVCRVALERGRLSEAIEAGERSVALDPTDGESWLILGAAYQQKGNAKDARRCYKSCVQEGKRGPRAECAAMLR